MPVTSSRIGGGCTGGVGFPSAVGCTDAGALPEAGTAAATAAGAGALELESDACAGALEARGAETFDADGGVAAIAETGASDGDAFVADFSGDFADSGDLVDGLAGSADLAADFSGADTGFVSVATGEASSIFTDTT